MARGEPVQKGRYHTRHESHRRRPPACLQRSFCGCRRPARSGRFQPCHPVRIPGGPDRPGNHAPGPRRRRLSGRPGSGRLPGEPGRQAGLRLTRTGAALRVLSGARLQHQRLRPARRFYRRAYRAGFRHTQRIRTGRRALPRTRPRHPTSHRPHGGFPATQRHRHPGCPGGGDSGRAFQQPGVGGGDRNGAGDEHPEPTRFHP